jgi:transcriptional regulator with XRE-family HTH domain
MSTHPQNLAVIAANVTRLRASKGLNQYALAPLAGLAPSVLYNVERGQGNPSVGTLGKIANALGVPLWELFLPLK